jgi:SAM-dependent methyltransferase
MTALNYSPQRNGWKDSAPFVSTKLGQFTYFSEQVGETDWRGKNVLDFGGNIGNILKDPHSTIDEERYWCLDVIPQSIERGLAAFPRAHWVLYDRYCFFFNPGGTPRLPLPSMPVAFDYIVAYSVFTNTPPGDMLDLVPSLLGLLAPGGVLAFTFIDPQHVTWPAHYEGNNFQWRVEREGGELDTAPVQRMLDSAADAEWCMLVNGKDLYVETEEMRPVPADEQESCHVFYRTSYIRKLFPTATILPPASDEMQHCCVIRNDA